MKPTDESRIPPAYVGHTWVHRQTEYRDGHQVEVMVETPWPPLRDDPQGPLNEAFLDYQNYQTVGRRERYPERYCTTCGASLSEPAIRMKRRRCARCLGWSAKQIENEARAIGGYRNPKSAAKRTDDEE